MQKMTDNASESIGRYVGTVEESSASLLSFEVAGSIETLRVDEGDKVSKGQLLARVSPTTLQEAHAATVATLKQAEDAYRRMKPLHAQGVITSMQWVDTESKLEQAQAAERMAREQLSHTGLYAPFSGVIASRNAELGMNVLPGQQVFKLVDVSQVHIGVSVPENEIPHIRKGTKARVEIEALGKSVYQGSVTEIGVEADPLSHTYRIKLTVANREGKLMPGMVCTVTLQADEGSSVTKTVPPAAIQLDSDNTRFVWIVEQGKAKRRTVRTGRFSEKGDVEIVSGLSPNDNVIVAGAQKVSEGMTVKVK